MSRDTTDATDSAPKRRRVLRMAGAALAAGTGLAAAGSATASDHCYYEYDCVEAICPKDEGGYTEMRRECCENDDGSVSCSDWEFHDCC
jgi:hypothetical protein